MRALLAVALVATPALAAPATQTLVGSVGTPDADGTTAVELIVINGGAATTIAVPQRVATQIVVDGVARSVSVERAADQADSAPLAAGGFVRTRYVLRPTPAAPSGTAAVVAASPAASFREDDRPFFGNLSAYNAMYAAYGPSETNDTRIQVSFKYQLFGRAGDTGPGRPWKNRIFLAYTQRMFADVSRQSNPFRNIDFMPELFYQFQPRAIGDGVMLGGQAGIRHESNGRAGDSSRSVNTIYVQPVATLTLGDVPLSVGPRLWVFVGSNEDNPRIGHYRGNTGLFLKLGAEHGLQLSTTSRFNPGSGKGSIDAELSYPLNRLVFPDLNLYLFGQAFAGYGENLLDYDRRQTRLRLGIGIVR